MKRDFLKADGRKGGFIKNTIDRVSGTPEPTFGPLDAVMIAALILGSVVAMRFLVGH